MSIVCIYKFVCYTHIHIFITFFEEITYVDLFNETNRSLTQGPKFI